MQEAQLHSRPVTPSEVQSSGNLDDYVCEPKTLRQTLSIEMNRLGVNTKDPEPDKPIGFRLPRHIQVRGKS